MQKLDRIKTFMLLIVASAFMLTGCTREISNEKTEQLILPTLFQYSGGEQQELKTELESGFCTVSDKLIEDYGIVRQQIREALK